MSTTIAVDPGKSGGIAYRTYDAVQVLAMPETVHDLVDALRSIAVRQISDGILSDCVIERVHSMPGDGGRQSFSFGENFGMLQGALAALGIPYRFVTPQQWQKKVGALPKEKAERKRALKAYAQQRFPYLEVTLKTADALAMLSVETNNKEN